MAGRLRLIPEGGALVEVTCRTLHGRFLLKPSRRLNKIILGVLGRAQTKHDFAVVSYVFLSNHYHLLVWAPNAQRLSAFMNFFNGNLAKEAGRLANWREKFWSRRYQAIVVSDEPAAQIGRLRYLLSHGVKEGFVCRPSDWPGVHAVHSHLENTPQQGVWVNRTRAFNARMKGKRLPKEEIESTETVTLAPLPCWAHLDQKTYANRISELVKAIERKGSRTTLVLRCLTHPASGRSARSALPLLTFTAPQNECAESSSRPTAGWSSPIATQLSD